MANIYWKRNRLNRQEAIDKLSYELIDLTESRFHVKATGDDGGSHLCVYIEKDKNGLETCETLPHIYEGWRLVQVYTPYEYIKYVLLAKKD
jgi:hypothetical protein